MKPNLEQLENRTVLSYLNVGPFTAYFSLAVHGNKVAGEMRNFSNEPPIDGYALSYSIFDKQGHRIGLPHYLAFEKGAKITTDTFEHHVFFEFSLTRPPAGGKIVVRTTDRLGDSYQAVGNFSITKQ